MWLNGIVQFKKKKDNKSFVSIVPFEAIYCFDMTHINKVLNGKVTESVDGIIGADVLKKSKAVIDYESNKLYLKVKI